MTSPPTWVDPQARRLKSPAVGTMMYDPESYSTKIYNGRAWVVITEEALENSDFMDHLHEMWVSDEYLISAYPDLLDLDPETDEYNYLLEKYRTFEILAQEN